jgi:hypothetical protein
MPTPRSIVCKVDRLDEVVTMTKERIAEGVAHSAGLRPFVSTNRIHEGNSIASKKYEILLMIYSGTPIS